MSKAAQVIVSHIADWCEDHGVPISQVTVTGVAALALHGVAIGVPVIRINLPKDILDNLIVESRENLVGDLEVFTFRDSIVEVFTTDQAPATEPFEALQITTMEATRDHFKALGELTGYNAYEQIATTMLHIYETDEEEMILVGDVMVPVRVGNKLHDLAKVGDFSDVLPVKDLFHITVWGGSLVNEEFLNRVGVPELRGGGDFWFATSEERQAFRDKLVAAEKATGKSGWVTRMSEGLSSKLRTMAKMKWKYGEKTYPLVYDFGFGYGNEAAKYMFTEGNWACAGNMSNFLHSVHPEVPGEQPCDCMDTSVYELVDFEDVRASEHITTEQQLRLWALGFSVHKLPAGYTKEYVCAALPGTCCPDFSCCDATLQVPKKQREAELPQRLAALTK